MRNRAFSGLDLSHRLDLSENAAFSQDRMTLVGGRKLLIDGCRGLLECSECRITAAMSAGKLTVTGSSLTIQAMTGPELLVSGKISCVEWE